MTYSSERYLKDLEERIDEAVEAELLARWQEFIRGRCTDALFSPRRTHLSPSQIDWPHVPVNQAIDDPESMVLQQFRGCHENLSTGSGNILAVRCNYGTGILPTAFGAQLFMMDEATDTLPGVRPMGADGVREILSRGLPDLNTGLWPRVMEMGERYKGILSQYPRIAGHVHVYHPDLQGPLDTCEMLWGSDLFMALYDAPEQVHQLLELVTQTYGRMMRQWRELFPSKNDWAVHWGMVHAGQIMLRDDSAMNISSAMFDEFVRPYDQRLLDEFGGGAIHFCGRGDHYIESLSQMKGMHGVQMSQPHLNDLETIFRNTVDKGIVLFGAPRSGFEPFVQTGRPTHGRLHASAP